MNGVQRAQVDFLAVVSQQAKDAGVGVYLVGGVVRDLLRGQEIGEKDFDFLVVGDAAAFAERCVARTGGTMKRFDGFLTAKIVAPSAVPWLNEIDFASSRTEVYPQPGQLPVVSPGSLQEDLGRRDFTINALALGVQDLLGWLARGTGDRGELEALVVDPHGGRRDLVARCVRSLHGDSFRDDPTRIFRAARYVARIDGTLAPETGCEIDAAVGSGALQTVSVTRIVNELKKIAREERFPEAFQVLEQFGVGAALGVPFAGAVGREVAAVRDRGVPANYRFEVLVRAWYAGGEGARVVAALGLGKKQARHVEVDVAADDAALAGNHVTVPGLWYALVRGVGDPDAVRRHLSVREER